MSDFTKRSLDFVVDHRGLTTLVLAATMCAGMLMAWPRDERGVPKERFWLVKAGWHHEADILATGDSRVYRGVSPDTIRGALDSGERVLNFGFSANGYGAAYLDAVERALDPAAAQPTLLLGVTPWSLTPRAIAKNGFLEASDLPAKERVVRHLLADLHSLFARVELEAFVR